MVACKYIFIFRCTWLSNALNFVLFQSTNMPVMTLSSMHMHCTGPQGEQSDSHTILWDPCQFTAMFTVQLIHQSDCHESSCIDNQSV